MKKIILIAAAMAVCISAFATAKIPDPGVYKIKNAYSGTYVRLQNAYLADITAPTADEATDLLVWYGKRDANGEAVLTDLSGGGGDMIETLAMIKGFMKTVLDDENQPTWFLDEMFELHLVPAGDEPGYVYLCVDVPAIDNWEDIRDIILQYAAGQQAVTYYINHMVPGNRHYMGIDYDGSFGYRLEAGTEEGTDIVFVMEPMDLSDYSDFCFIKTASRVDETPYLEHVHQFTPTVGLATPYNSASAVFQLGIGEQNVLSKFAVQGYDFAAVASAIGNGAYISANATNSTADKFVYNTVAIKLQLPDTDVDAAQVIAAAAQVLGQDHAIVKALTEHSDLITDRTALYFVHSADDALTVTDEDGYFLYGDDAKWMVEVIDNDVNYVAAVPDFAYDNKYYTTFFAAQNYSLENNANVTAYAVSSVNKKGEPTLVKIEGQVIPANQPVVLEMATDVDTDNILVPVAANAQNGAPLRVEEPASVFEGTLFDDEVANDAQNKLTLQDNLVFQGDDSLSFLPANKAWANKQLFTAVSELNAAEVTSDDAIYDLMGRKVNEMSHGIYIVGGKKVVK